MAMTKAEFDALLAKIRANPTQSGYGNGIGLGATGGAYMDQDSGKGLIPLYEWANTGNGGESADFGSRQIGWRDQDTADSMAARDKSILNGRTYNNYDMDGNVTGTGKWEGLKKGSAEMQALTALAIAAGGYLGGSALAGAAGGGAGAAGAAGSVAGDAFLPGALAANGGFAVPYGSLIPGLEGYAAAAGAAGGAAGAGGAGGGGGTAAGASGGSSLLGGGGAGGAGALGSLGGAGGLGSLIAPALGAIAGSKGTEVPGSPKMDSRLDGYVYGDKGLMPTAFSLMQADQDPTRRAQREAFRNEGMSLLGQPMAGNPFMDGRRTLFR